MRGTVTCFVTPSRYSCRMEPIRTTSETLDMFAALSDDELVDKVKDLAGRERRASVALIRSLMEFDARRLYLREGCSSLFTYCTQVLHLSEGSAYNRIETARAARRYPNVLDALERGDLTLTAVRLLAPHLTLANHCEVLATARHRSKQGIQELIASLNPRPAAATIIRRVEPQTLKGDATPAFAVAQEVEPSSSTTTAVTSAYSPGRQDAASDGASVPRRQRDAARAHTLQAAGDAGGARRTKSCGARRRLADIRCQVETSARSSIAR